MSLANVEALKEAVANWLNRADLAVMIPDFIRLCEADLQRRVVHVMGMSSTATLLAASGGVTLPADFNGVMSAKARCRLGFVPPDVFYSYSEASGSPGQYTLIGDQMKLYPEPSDGETVTLVYRVKFAVLTSGTNWLLTNHPDAYLFGALAHAEPYIGEDIRLPLWKQKYEEALSSIESAGIRLTSGGSLQLKSNGSV